MKKFFFQILAKTCWPGGRSPGRVPLRHARRRFPAPAGAAFPSRSRGASACARAARWRWPGRRSGGWASRARAPTPARPRGREPAPRSSPRIEPSESLQLYERCAGTAEPVVLAFLPLASWLCSLTASSARTTGFARSYQRFSLCNY